MLAMESEYTECQVPPRKLPRWSDKSNSAVWGIRLQWTYRKKKCVSLVGMLPGVEILCIMLSQLLGTY